MRELIRGIQIDRISFMIQLILPQSKINFNSFLPLGSFNVSLSIPQSLLWIIFVFAVIIFAIFSLIFVYHWKRYALDFLASTKAHVIYFSVSAGIIANV